MDMTADPRNVIGQPLAICGCAPMTGYFRTGSCDTGPGDLGNHSVCAVMTGAFLTYTKSRGNDLSTARPEFGFPGLKAGDHWCLCASRWLEAYHAGAAPEVLLAATHERALEVVDLSMLKAKAAASSSTD